MYAMKAVDVAGVKQTPRDGRNRTEKWITLYECVLYSLVIVVVVVNGW